MFETQDKVAICIQRYTKGYLERKKYKIKKEKEFKAALVIQSMQRRVRDCKKVVEFKKSIQFLIAPPISINNTFIIIECDIEKLKVKRRVFDEILTNLQSYTHDYVNYSINMNQMYYSTATQPMLFSNKFSSELYSLLTNHYALVVKRNKEETRMKQWINTNNIDLPEHLKQVEANKLESDELNEQEPPEFSKKEAMMIKEYKQFLNKSKELKSNLKQIESQIVLSEVPLANVKTIKYFKIFFM